MRLDDGFAGQKLSLDITPLEEPVSNLKRFCSVRIDDSQLLQFLISRGNVVLPCRRIESGIHPGLVVRHHVAHRVGMVFHFVPVDVSKTLGHFQAVNNIDVSTFSDRSDDRLHHAFVSFDKRGLFLIVQSRCCVQNRSDADAFTGFEFIENLDAFLLLQGNP